MSAAVSAVVVCCLAGPAVGRGVANVLLLAGLLSLNNEKNERFSLDARNVV